MGGRNINVFCVKCEPSKKLGKDWPYFYWPFFMLFLGVDDNVCFLLKESSEKASHEAEGCFWADGRCETDFQKP